MRYLIGFIVALVVLSGISYAYTCPANTRTYCTCSNGQKEYVSLKEVKELRTDPTSCCYVGKMLKVQPSTTLKFKPKMEVLQTITQTPESSSGEFSISKSFPLNALFNLFKAEFPITNRVYIEIK